MLNKVKVGVVVAFVLSVVRFFLPDLALPAGLEEAIVLIAVFVAQFFVKETPKTVAALDLS
jgi:multisubunit Na+/H+ antiporter MnhB subunit